jgi:hypothetical protein
VFFNPVQCLQSSIDKRPYQYLKIKNTTIMRTSLRCNQNSKWRTAMTGGVKAFLTLFLLIFLTTKLTAQITIDGDPGDWCNTLATQPIKALVTDPRGNGVLDNQFTQGSKDFMTQLAHCGGK